MHRNLQAIVLAAGKSKRLNTQKSKLLEKICGQEMILYTTKLLNKFSIHTTVVVGHQKELLKSVINSNHDDINFVEQSEQLGTGHAVFCTKDSWQKKYILVLNSDAPLITEDIISDLYKKHVEENAKITFVTAHNLDPSINSYGKVIKEENKISIIEAKDDIKDRKEECCINAGIYLFDKDFLEEALPKLQKSSVTGELYITDLIKIASDNDYKVETTDASFDLVRGINTFQELWTCEQIKRADLIKYWMSKGIRFATAQNSHIDLNVSMESGTSIGSCVQLFGSTKIGKNCKIDAFCILEDATIEDNVHVQSHTIIKKSIIKKSSVVGPFAHVNEAVIADNSSIGNFVGLNASQIGSQTNIKNLSYIGNSEIGNNVSIGTGTITCCTSTGIVHEKTVIQDRASIGGNNSLIAPVNIGKDAFTACGSVITKNVPDQALGIARAPQINKNEYSKKLKQPTFYAAKKIEKDSSNSL